MVDPFTYLPTELGLTLPAPALRLSYQLKDKLYSLFHLLKSSYPVAELGVQDQWTMATMQRNLDFYVGRAWKEMRAEVETMCLKMLRADHSVHETVERELARKQAEVQKRHLELERSHIKVDMGCACFWPTLARNPTYIAPHRTTPSSHSLNPVGAQ